MKWWRNRAKAREDTVLAVLFEQQRRFERGEAERWLYMEYISMRVCLTHAQTVGALARLQLAGFIQTDGGGHWRFKVPEDAGGWEPRKYRSRCGECGSDWLQVEASNASEWHEVGCRSGQWLVAARSQQVMTYGYD